MGGVLQLSGEAVAGGFGFQPGRLAPAGLLGGADRRRLRRRQGGRMARLAGRPARVMALEPDSREERERGGCGPEAGGEGDHSRAAWTCIQS